MRLPWVKRRSFDAICKLYDQKVMECEYFREAFNEEIVSKLQLEKKLSDKELDIVFAEMVKSGTFFD